MVADVAQEGGEPFDAVQLLSFSLVWAGLILVTLDGLRRARKQPGVHSR